MIRIVVDLATDRVIWFTTDPDLDIVPEPESIICDYEGELPEGMTPVNSWNYRFRNQKVYLADPVEPRPLKSLLDNNKEEITQLLRKEVDRVRQQVCAASLPALEVRLVKQAAVVAHIAGTATPSQEQMLRSMALPNESLPEVVRRIRRAMEEGEKLLCKSELMLRTWLSRIEACTSATEIAGYASAIKQDISTLKE